MVTRRHFLKTLGVGMGAAMLPGCSLLHKSKPNFLFILVDDLGISDLSCYGSRFYETPNLDKLAASGTRFTEAYASCPVCSPTRASIMTGKYPTRLNITDWIPGNDPKDRKLLGPQDKHELPLEEKTIAEALHENGYQTFFAGKWYLGDKGYFPEDQGFDINKGGHHVGSPPNGYYVPYKIPNLPDGPEGEYLTDRLTNESIRFLEEKGSNPFLLYLAFYTVHTPIEACKRHLAKFEAKATALPETDAPVYIFEYAGHTRQIQNRADYASMLYAMDENVGRVLDKLEELGLSENTVVIFTSDNGGLASLYPNRDAPTANLPYRAGKGWCYEGGIRVPLIIRTPGEQSFESDEPVISMDFYPTMLELAGIPAIPEQHVDGKSLVSLLNGAERLDRKALYWHYPHYHGSAWTPGATVRARDWKLIELYHEEKTELYNLKEDVGEHHDLAADRPDKVEELQNMLHLWQKEAGALMPKVNPDY